MRRVPESLPLSDPPPTDPSLRWTRSTGRLERCKQADPFALRLGERSLRDYLIEIGDRWIVDLEAALRAMDDLWVTFLPPTDRGRPPYHPRILVGLVMYGMLTGQSSLRQLEELAARDLGAWWLCAGLRPDHSTLGNFVDTHADRLTDDFFVGITSRLARALRLKVGDVAIDGTITESAASALRGLRKEAAHQRRVAAEALAAEAPDDPERQRAAEAARVVEATIDARIEAREAQSLATGSVAVSPSDPEAVFQPRKDGAFRPAWVASILAHASGLILGQFVTPSGESAAVLPLLGQHGRILGAAPTCALMDGNYHCLSVIEPLAAGGVEALCPAVSAKNAATPLEARKRFDKHLFVYQPDSDQYVCPRGQSLLPFTHQTDRAGRHYTRYRSTSCDGCADRLRCTESATGRVVKRYDGDALKEAIVARLRTPEGKAQYRRRAAMVEPPFGVLRERQGLRRFHRRGQRLVAAEFALHVTAYNLRKALRLWRSSAARGTSRATSREKRPHAATARRGGIAIRVRPPRSRPLRLDNRQPL